MTSPTLDPLPRDFYDRDVRQVAREMLGKLLVRRSRDGITVGRIVETEAYLPEGDSACHAVAGPNRKTAAIFGLPGTGYVYVIHARHCFNAVADASGVGCAALIRAVEPVRGVALMQKRRQRVELLDLARGPARLCEAFAIDRTFNGWDLTIGRSLFLADDEGNGGPNYELGVQVSTPRIGVTSAKDLPLRYIFADNQYVSGPKHLRSRN
ncbi:MAG: DNA-3-methyladenine glycosylase [Pirellulales bacterium]|nr:DNA-3-methyladenine glycosylase [Pirellulales bacterium]